MQIEDDIAEYDLYYYDDEKENEMKMRKIRKKMIKIIIIMMKTHLEKEELEILLLF